MLHGLAVASLITLALAPSAHAGDTLALPHGSYVSTLLNESTHRPEFTYTVVCESTRLCQMTFDAFGDVLNRPLERSDRLVRQVQDTLQWVKAHSYPASLDAEYKPLEGQTATDCWDASDPEGVAGLCQFKDANGASTWVVLGGHVQRQLLFRLCAFVRGATVFTDQSRAPPIR